MKKLLLTCLALVLAAVLAVPAFASGEDYTFSLTVDGLSEASVRQGDEFTVALTLNRRDIADFDLYSLQDYVCFDPSYFSIVDGSITAFSIVQGEQVSPVFSASPLKFNSDHVNRVFVNRAGTRAQSLSSGTQVLTFQLKALKTGRSVLFHDAVELFRTVGSSESFSTQNAVVTIADRSDSGDTPSGGGGGGGVSSPGDEAVTNPDGSVTTTVTDPRTGAVTKTTKKPDGIIIIVVTQPDGSLTVSETRTDGTRGTTTVSALGVVAAEAEISRQAVEAAAKAGEAVILPVAEIRTAAGTDAAPTVRVSLPELKVPVKIEIPVENATPGTVLVLAREDGSEQVLRNTALTQSGVSAALDASAVLKVVDNTRIFSDLAPVAGWAGDAVTFVAARELFGGVGENRFAPTADMDRAMLVTVLHRLENEPGGAAALPDYKDSAQVPDWSAEAMRWGVEHGIITGNGSALQPAVAVSREQLVTILHRYAGAPAPSGAGLDGFTDAVQVSGWAEDAMKWAVGQGLIGGKDGGRLAPADAASRAEVAAILMRFLNQR